MDKLLGLNLEVINLKLRCEDNIDRIRSDLWSLIDKKDIIEVEKRLEEMRPSEKAYTCLFGYKNFRIYQDSDLFSFWLNINVYYDYIINKYKKGYYPFIYSPNYKGDYYNESSLNILNYIKKCAYNDKINVKSKNKLNDTVLHFNQKEDYDIFLYFNQKEDYDALAYDFCRMGNIFDISEYKLLYPEINKHSNQSSQKNFRDEYLECCKNNYATLDSLKKNLKRNFLLMSLKNFSLNQDIEYNVIFHENSIDKRFGSGTIIKFMTKDKLYNAFFDYMLLRDAAVHFRDSLGAFKHLKDRDISNILDYAMHGLRKIREKNENIMQIIEEKYSEVCRGCYLSEYEFYDLYVRSDKNIFYNDAYRKQYKNIAASKIFYIFPEYLLAGIIKEYWNYNALSKNSRLFSSKNHKNYYKNDSDIASSYKMIFIRDISLYKQWIKLCKEKDYHNLFEKVFISYNKEFNDLFIKIPNITENDLSYTELDDTCRGRSTYYLMDKCHFRNYKQFETFLNEHFININDINAEKQKCLAMKKDTLDDLKNYLLNDVKYHDQIACSNNLEEDCIKLITKKIDKTTCNIYRLKSIINKLDTILKKINIIPENYCNLNDIVKLIVLYTVYHPNNFFILTELYKEHNSNDDIASSAKKIMPSNQNIFDIFHKYVNDQVKPINIDYIIENTPYNIDAIREEVMKYDKNAVNATKMAEFIYYKIRFNDLLEESKEYIKYYINAI